LEDVTGMITRRNKQQSERGASIVEAALMSPWIFLLMVGVLDMGFYAYAAINTQNAARAAALALASGTMDVSQVCDLVRLEMRNLPNVAPLTTCLALPLKVTTGDYTQTPTGVPNPVRIRTATVEYETIPLLKIPGITNGTLKFARTAEVASYE
jgi:Flp pilus assembly protein TadG